MPTYGYECLSCDNQFEIIQSIKDDALTVCDSCGGSLRKRIYPVGIAFKGSGFYVNDYAAKPSGAASASGSSDAVKSDTPTADTSKPESGGADVKAATAEPAKTETKAEAKTEAKAPAAGSV